MVKKRENCCGWGEERREGDFRGREATVVSINLPLLLQARPGVTGVRLPSSGLWGGNLTRAGSFLQKEHRRYAWGRNDKYPQQGSDCTQCCISAADCG